MAPTRSSKCPACTKPISPNDAYTPCLVCKPYFHDNCVLSVGLLTTGIQRVKQTTSTFHFICKNCKANIVHVATTSELELRAKLLKMEADAATQLHAANKLADAAEIEKISLKKTIQDLTRRLELSGTSPENTATLARNRELSSENKKLNTAILKNQNMQDELKSLKEVTDKIPEFKAEYDRVVAERNERDATLARYSAYIKDMDETNVVKDNLIKDLRLEIKAKSQTQNQQPIASTSQQASKRQNTDMHHTNSDLINFTDIEQHINNTIGNRFQKIEDSHRQMVDAMDQIRAALITNMPSVNFTQLPRIQRSSTPAPGNRARSTSRKNVELPDNKPKQVKMSYAAALTKSTIRPDVIRNVNILGTPDEVKLILQDLREGTHIKGAGIASVKPKGKTNLTLTFNNADEAQKTEEILNNAFRDKLIVKKVQTSSPQIKITRIFTKLVDTADIDNQIRDQNHWLRTAPFDVAREYSVETANGTYRNIIINCDLILQKEFIRREAIIFGLSECRCFEYVDVLRCNKCLRYGHFARECSFLPTCKKCTEHHETEQCVAVQIVEKCTNCILSNKRGTSYSTKHRTTDERCPVRVERVEALKIYHLTEKPKN